MPANSALPTLEGGALFSWSPYAEQPNTSVRVSSFLLGAILIRYQWHLAHWHLIGNLLALEDRISDGAKSPLLPFPGLTDYERVRLTNYLTESREGANRCRDAAIHHLSRCIRPEFRAQVDEVSRMLGNLVPNFDENDGQYLVTLLKFRDIPLSDLETVDVFGEAQDLFLTKVLGTVLTVEIPRILTDNTWDDKGTWLKAGQVIEEVRFQPYGIGRLRSRWQILLSPDEKLHTLDLGRWECRTVESGDSYFTEERYDLVRLLTSVPAACHYPLTKLDWVSVRAALQPIVSETALLQLATDAEQLIQNHSPGALDNFVRRCFSAVGDTDSHFEQLEPYPTFASPRETPRIAAWGEFLFDETSGKLSRTGEVIRTIGPLQERNFLFLVLNAQGSIVTYATIRKSLEDDDNNLETNRLHHIKRQVLIQVQDFGIAIKVKRDEGYVASFTEASSYDTKTPEPGASP